MKEQENFENLHHRKRNRNSKIQSKFEDLSDDEEETNFGYKKSFKFVYQNPSLKEREILDENKLLNTISMLKSYIQGNSECQLDNLDYLNNKETNSFGSVEKETSCDSLKIENDYLGEENCFDSIITQNIAKTNKSLKLLMLGDQGVGKTKLKNLIKNKCQIENSENQLENSDFYSNDTRPTLS